MTDARTIGKFGRLLFAIVLPLVVCFTFIVELAKQTRKAVWFASSYAKEEWQRGRQFVRTGKLQ